ncbi:MAG TPA: spore germination protein [Firmicutes bacterium]|nr:spore germination protein [Bacillota bacterium]
MRKRRSVPGKAVSTLQRTLSTSLSKNIGLFDELFRGDNTIIKRPFQSGGAHPLRCCIFYCDGMVNNGIINENILRPVTLWQQQQPQEGGLLLLLERRVLQINELKHKRDVNDMVRDMLYGDTLLLCDGSDEALVLNTKGFTMRSIAEPESEQVLRGPREGFTEGILMNLSMIRRKLRTADLKFEYLQCGEQSKTTVCLCYIEGVTDQKVLAQVRQRMEQVQIDGVLDSNYVQELIRDRPWTPFKTVGSTERPDVVAAKLLEGRAAILVDGSPVALTVPHLFIEQFQSSEDYYVGWYFAAISRVIRVVGFLFSISVVPVYIALITFHQEMLPTPLLFSISAAREGVPFPTALEALGLLLAFEILRESGERTPAGFGQTLSIVGGLVLGQAAVEARFISAPMVIVVAFSGITGLMLPRVKGAVIWWRLALILLSAWMGLLGFLMGMVWMMLHLCTLESFGVPVMRGASILTGRYKEDAYCRPPWKKMKRFGRFLAGGEGYGE